MILSTLGGAKPLLLIYFFLFLALLAGGYSPAAEAAARTKGRPKRAVTTALQQDQVISDAVSSNVFRVVGVTEQGIMGGTAFVLNVNEERMIITNKHICDTPTLGGMFFLLQGDMIYFARVEKISERTDLCKLLPRQQYAPTQAGIPISLNRLRVGDKITSYGYASGKPLIKNSGRYLNEELNTDLSQMLGLAPFKAQQVSFTVFPGNSGSPVLDDRGSVVGVVFAYSGNYGLIVPLDALTDFVMNEILAYVSIKEEAPIAPPAVPPTEDQESDPKEE